MTWEELIIKISIGSIFDLKTKYKDFKAKNIGLDLYGFDAVLPLKEISNNYDLSFSLFNTLKKGEIISLVLIDIDDKNQRLTFSTKVFRNALDDVLPFTHCVNLINGNFRRRRNLPNNFLLEQRKILDRLRGDLSSNELTFLYELIQNAVDHPNRNFNNNVSINFEVFNNYLLVKHNGALFTENNFESITGILYGEQIQEGDRNRIGYKGIGFKSVFRYTDNAYVRSGNFSFRFSKAESGIDKPWEVLPLFQLEKDLVPLIPQFDFFNAPVAFAFEFNSEQSRNYVIKYLNQLSQNPYLLIFLENLTQLKIKAPSLTFSENGISQNYPVLEVNFIKDVSKKDDFNSINLFVNNSSHSEWLIYTKDDIVITDKEVINELLNESVTAVPAKMRQFRTPSITVALPRNKLNDEVINLFTYLPLSNSKFKLPFLVNADFIPDLDRTDIIHNLKYNTEVLKFVAITLQEFSQKLAIKNQFEYLNTLLPDFNIEYQSSGNVIVNNLLDYLPQTKIEFNGKHIPISNIAIDKSGFVSSFGLELYNTLIDSENVPLSTINEHKRISKLIEKINPDGVSDFHKLKEKVRSDYFKEWLKNPISNSQFLKYLSQSKHLDVFSDEFIYLAQDGDLHRGFDLLINLGSDELDIEWLSYQQVLNSDVFTMLKDIALPLRQYEPISFINEVICREKKVEIITGLTNGSIPFDDFYSYLSKYAANALFPASEIKSFPVKTSQAIFPSWSGTIYFNISSLSGLLSANALPDGLFHLIVDNWSSNSNLKLLGEKLGVNTYSDTEPFGFIQTILAANNVSINRFYLSQTNISINSNATLWSFILSAYKNLSDTQKETIFAIIKTLPVLSKKGSFKELHTLYLPSEFTDNDALETLSLQFPNSNIDFVSADYLKHPSIDKTEIRTLFKKLDAKTDTKDFLQHTLIPNLHQISTDLLVPLARLLYENRESDPIINAVIGNSHFKLKTKEGTYIPINECYVGSPYIEESKVPNPIIAVPVVNQITADYSHNQLDAWQRFFSERLKVKELINEAEIISLKLKHIVDNVQQWQNADISVSLLRDIYHLYKSGRLALSSTNLSYIKRIPLLCKGDNKSNFHTPNAIHFSSAFKPTFDFEKIFGIECGVPFLSELYRFEDATELIQFFENIGVAQYYEQNRHNVICQNIPSADGQKKPASQLFKYEFKKYVGQSNVAFEDLSKFTHNGRTLEDWFGFKSKLDVNTILSYITTSQPNRRELKDLITELLKVYNPNNYNDKNLINAFIAGSKLLSTSKAYNLVSELHSIDESIRSGIRENEYLIDPLFSKHEQDFRKKYYGLFGIKTLGIEDFNPHFEGDHMDYEFSKRVEERLVLLAFDSDDEKYLEIEDEFKAKFKEWKIRKCSKISLKYPANDSKIIKEDNRNFILSNEKTIYYIGNWVEQRNFLLVLWLNDNILNIKKQLQFVQDILLNNTSDIIADFENKGRAVTDEIKQRFKIPQPTQQETKTPEGTQTEATKVNPETKETTEEPRENPFKDITPDDEKYIREIITGVRELNEKLDANTTAKIKTLLKIKDLYQGEEISDEEYYLKVGELKIIVRSAQNGLLFLDINHWERFAETNVYLSVYTNNEVKIFETQEALFNSIKDGNKLGIIKMPDDYKLNDLNSVNSPDKEGVWRFVFIVNENTKAAKNYKEVMNLDDYNF
jgi:hypothetical protein